MADVTEWAWRLIKHGRRRRIMRRDGAAVMSCVGLERRRLRRFGGAEETNYGGSWSDHFSTG